MTDFVFNEKVTDAIKDTVSAALGSAAAQGYGDNDIGKPVVMGSANNYVIAGDGVPIEGFINAIEPDTVNQGFAFGSVQRAGRKIVEVAATYTVTLGGYVLAAAQSAAGVASTGANALPKVRPAVATAAADDGASLTNAGLYAWRVIRLIDGVGTAGAKVLIERV